jgi:AhpD family alkylhydroperoxidase
VTSEEGPVTAYLRKTNQATLLTEREKQLIRLAVTVTRDCPICTRGRFDKARSAGIEEDVLNAVLGIVCRSCCPGHDDQPVGAAVAVAGHGEDAVCLAQT